MKFPRASSLAYAQLSLCESGGFKVLFVANYGELTRSD